MLLLLLWEMLYSAFSLTGLKSTARKRPFVEGKSKLCHPRHTLRKSICLTGSQKPCHWVPQGRSVMYFALYNRTFIQYGLRSPYSCETKKSRGRKSIALLMWCWAWTSRPFLGR